MCGLHPQKRGGGRDLTIQSPKGGNDHQGGGGGEEWGGGKGGGGGEGEAGEGTRGEGEGGGGKGEGRRDDENSISFAVEPALALRELVERVHK